MIKGKNYFRLLSYLTVFLAIISFWGCEDDPVSPEIPINYKFGNGLIVLNEGANGQNNASVTYKSFESDSLFQNVFENANGGAALGDVANHIAVNNGKAYIVVNNSNKIEVVGLQDFKIAQTINLGAGSSPRSISFYGSYAYVSSYKDYVYKIGLSDGKVADSIQVGSKPEGIAEANGKLFVVNSGWGMDSTVSVIDGATGENIKTITVGINPQHIIKGDDGFIYAVGGGSYSDPNAESGLWKINPQTLNVDDVIEISGNPGKICNYKNNTLLLVNSGGAYLVNPSARTAVLAIPVSEVNPGGSYPTIYALAYDVQTDLIYCGNPKNYTQNGEVVVFKEESGSFVKKSSFDCGLMPNWIVVVR